MKRAIAFSLLLGCCGVILGAHSNPPPVSRKTETLLQDLVRMTRAGSSDVTVLEYAKAHRLELPPELTSDDLRFLRESGVSELVVRYMAAIDVRASGESAPEDVAYGSSDDGVRPRASYSSSESDYEGYADGYSGGYAGSYADSDYGAYAGYGYDYDYGYYSPYGYASYPYPIYFFVDQRGFLHRFRGRDHRFRGHRGFDRGRGFRGPRGGVDRGGARDSWRERSFTGRRGSPTVVDPRGPGRPGLARDGFRTAAPGPRGRVVGPRGFGPPGPARGAAPSGFRGPGRGAPGPGGFSRPAFSGGFRSGGSLGSGPRMAPAPAPARGRR